MLRITFIITFTYYFTQTKLMPRHIKLNICIFFTICFVNVLSSQKIIGKLTDKVSGAGQPAIQLSLVGTDISVFTNASGRFIFTDVPNGTYTMVANFNGSLVEVAQITVNGPVLNLDEVSVVVPEVIVSANDISVVDAADLSSIENENDNFASALSAGRDPFLNASIFHLNAGRFRPRGYFNEDSDMFINGMLMNDQDDGRVLWTSFNSLNNVFVNRGNVINMTENELTFGGIGGASYIDLRASNLRPGARVVYSFSNRIFQHRVMASYNTGMMQNGWAISACASHSYADQPYIKGNYMQSNGYFLSIDRKLGDKHLLNFVTFGVPQRRGRSTGTVQEMYDIAGSNFYNPNWGFQNGEVRNSREYLIHQPVSMLRHDWKINTQSNITTTIGFQFGRSGSTRLDWYDAPDPRPDYYRNLPSYADDPTAKNLITNFLQASEANRQVNWAKFYQVNAGRDFLVADVDGIVGNNVQGKLAAYVLETENFDNTKFNFNSVYNSNVSDRVFITAGIQHLTERVHFYRRMEDLLGADFYVDFNRFALRDFPGNQDAAQNDVNRPNRLVREGDIYGHNYDINTARSTVWGQAVVKGDRIDYFAAFSLANQSFYREGYTKVGLFQENSFGKSEKYNFANIGFKGGVTYKLDGRNYFVANGSYRTRAPFASEAFVSPRVRDQVVSNLTNEKITSFDLTYLARYTRFKARVTAFFTDFKDKINNDVYYHEEFRTFVNYLMTGINRRHMGIEFGAEYRLTQKFSVSLAGSVGEYYHTSRPLATISRDNSAEDFVQNRVIYIENYYVAGTPQVAGTLGFSYFSNKRWIFNLNVNAFAKNYLAFNPDRRTSEAIKGVDPSDGSGLFNQIIDQEKLPDAITVDLGVSKSYRLKDGSSFNFNLNVGNVLNKTNFITGGFEQLRFDVVDKDVNRFPPRYFYAFGTNFIFSIAYNFGRP